MPELVTIAVPTGTDNYNTPTYGTGVAYPARIERKLTHGRDFNGIETMANVTIWVAPEQVGGTLPTLSPNILITLPDGSHPKLLWYQDYPDETGQGHHQKLATT